MTDKTARPFFGDPIIFCGSNGALSERIGNGALVISDKTAHLLLAAHFARGIGITDFTVVCSDKTARLFFTAYGHGGITVVYRRIVYADKTAEIGVCLNTARRIAFRDGAVVDRYESADEIGIERFIRSRVRTVNRRLVVCRKEACVRVAHGNGIGYRRFDIAV